MLRSHVFLRAAAIAAAFLLAAGVGAFIFREPLSQHFAAASAQAAFGRDTLNLLILGYQDDESTTDTIMLVHLDVTREIATLVSIPRDTWVAIPGHGHDKINAAYAYGGAKTTASVVSALLGNAPIDATLAVQPEGAAQIVDAMGGLNVNVDEAMNYDDDYGELHIHLKPGEQYLTGSQVVGYMRFRHDAASDFGRVKRQQQVIKAMMTQLSQPQNWQKLPRILAFARKDIKTSLSDQQIGALLEIYRNTPDDNVRALTLPSKPGWVGDASVVFADQRWATWIGTLLFSKQSPPAEPVIVANATGNVELDKTVVAVLRGAGWNVPTAVAQPQRSTSVVLGAGDAAKTLASIFAVSRREQKATTLVIGSDLTPDS